MEKRRRGLRRYENSGYRSTEAKEATAPQIAAQSLRIPGKSATDSGMKSATDSDLISAIPI